MSNNVIYHSGRKGMKWGQHIFGQASNFTKDLQTVERSVPVRRRATRIRERDEMKNKSNKELQEEINRAKLEEEYIRVVKSPKLSKGRQNVRDALNIIGPTLAASASALAIAVSVKDLLDGKEPPSEGKKKNKNNNKNKDEDDD